MFRVALLLVLWWMCGVAAAAPACHARAEGAPGYAKATQVVARLPEYTRWARAAGFPVAFLPAVDHEVRLHGRCYWAVSVYANRPERMELWHTFYVAVAGGSIRVDDPFNGKTISLRAWRASRDTW